MSENARKRITEDFHPSSPPKDIICKDCVHRPTDILKDGEVLIPGFWKGVCGVYDGHGTNIPHAVLWEYGKCPFYQKEG